jgi:hypothetical protein
LRQRLVLGATAGIAIAAFSCAALSKVYTCVDPKTHTREASQLPCPQAGASSPAEIVADAEERRLIAIRAQLGRDAVIADQQLLRKYANDAAHRKAHVADLEGVIRNIQLSTARFDELAAQRKPLDQEAMFYRGKPLPAALQRRIDASDASFNALGDVFRGLQAEVVDIEATRGRERERLARLWAGERPGSMGLLVPVSASSAGK